MVLQAGSRMIWAKEVTCKVESVPSVPWTSTEAPSLRQTCVLRLYTVSTITAQCFDQRRANNLLMCSILYMGGFVAKANQTTPPNLSMHWAARQAVVRISLTWVCQLDASSLLNQRSMLWDWSLHASTSFMRLSWRTLDLEMTYDSFHRPDSMLNKLNNTH